MLVSTQTIHLGGFPLDIHICYSFNSTETTTESVLKKTWTKSWANKQLGVVRFYYISWVLGGHYSQVSLWMTVNDSWSVWLILQDALVLQCFLVYEKLVRYIYIYYCICQHFPWNLIWIHIWIAEFHYICILYVFRLRVHAIFSTKKPWKKQHLNKKNITRKKKTQNGRKKIHQLRQSPLRAHAHSWPESWKALNCCVWPLELFKKTLLMLMATRNPANSPVVVR